MIINETPVELSGNLVYQDEIDMDIDDSARSLILQALIDMYPNPYLATLREYASNGYDAHFVAKQTRPVEITLPSALSPLLVIQDWGTGMDRAALAVYGQFGASTKRDNNDEIGGFGLGSKSGLAVASQFVVQSVKDGKKNVVVVGRKPSGAPRMGMMPEEDTDEPNGTRIEIPTSKAEEYRRAVESGIFLGWPEGSVLIDGEAPPLSIDSERFTKLGEFGWLDNSEGGDRVSRVLIGPLNVPYEPYKAAVLEDRGDGVQVEDVDTMQERSGVYNRLILKLPNGVPTLLRSRDGFVYDDNTIRALARARQGAYELVKPIYQAKVEACSDHWEAYRTIDQLQRNRLGSDYVFQGTKPKISSFGSKPTYTTKQEELDALPIFSYVAVRRSYSDKAYTLSCDGFYMSEFGTYIRSLYNSGANPKDPATVRAVLIIESPSEHTGTSSYYGNNRRHKSLTFVSSLISALADEADVASDYYAGSQVFFVEGDLSAYTAWDLAPFTNIFTYEEAKTKASEWRAAQRAAQRAANPNVPRRASSGNKRRAEVRVAALSSYGYTVTPVAALDTNRPVYVLRAGSNVEDEIIQWVLYRKYRTGGTRQELIQSAMSDMHVQIVYETKTDKTQDWKALGLKTVTLDEMVLAYLTERISELPEPNIKGQATADKSTFLWIQYHAREVIPHIKSATTKEWFEAVAELYSRGTYGRNEYERKADQIVGLIGAAESLGITPPEFEPEKVVLTDYTKGRYPLIESSGYRIDAASFVWYINARDEFLDA